MTYATEHDSAAVLEREIAAQGLHVEDIYEFLPPELSVRRRILVDILRWTRAWQLCPDRRTLESMGFMYPPVDPDIDPETDWFRFERWMRGEPLRWTFEQEFGPLPEPSALAGADLTAAVDRVLALLETRGVVVDLPDAVPDQVLYDYLFTELRKGYFHLCAPGTHTHLTGCTGWCEECFQLEWCHAAKEASVWADHGSI